MEATTHTIYRNRPQTDSGTGKVVSSQCLTCDQRIAGRLRTERIHTQMTIQWNGFYTFTNLRIHSNSRIPVPTIILPFKQIRIKNQPLVLRQFKYNNDCKVIHSLKQRKTWITCAAPGAPCFGSTLSNLFQHLPWASMPRPFRPRERTTPLTLHTPCEPLGIRKVGTSVSRAREKQSQHSTLQEIDSATVIHARSVQLHNSWQDAHTRH